MSCPLEGDGMTSGGSKPPPEVRDPEGTATVKGLFDGIHRSDPSLILLCVEQQRESDLVAGCDPTTDVTVVTLVRHGSRYDASQQKNPLQTKSKSGKQIRV